MRVKGNATPGAIHPSYSYPGNANRSMLQGFYMATPAVDVAWLMNQSNAIERDGHDGNSVANSSSSSSSANTVTAYLAELEAVLTKFDAWMWSARSSSDGVLWLPGTADTGEDGSDKYGRLYTVV